MKVGDTIVLWKEDFSAAAYVDQMGVSREGYVVNQEVVATISAVKQVPGCWRPETKYEGYQATDADGNVYECNWTTFPDDSMTPTYYWASQSAKGRYHQWCDAIQASNYGYPHVRPDGSKAVPAGAEVCTKHKSPVTYEKTLGCWRCNHDIE